MSDVEKPESKDIRNWKHLLKNEKESVLKMSKLTIVFLALVAATIAVTSADLSESEKVALKAAALPMLKECAQELDIPEKDLLAAKESKNVDAVNPCFYLCFFKKVGIINEKAEFDAAAAIEKSSKFVSGEEALQKIAAVANTCSDVNDQASDAEGCDRAKLLVNCFIKEKYGFLSE